MATKSWHFMTCGALAAALLSSAALAQSIEFKDPTGDDNGPGEFKDSAGQKYGPYKYPTDPVYKPGSFDLTGLKVTKDGDRLNFEVGVNSNLEDPWKMGTGFSVQMAFIFIKTGTEGGFTDGLPGLNVKFDPKSAWDKVVILSPQGPSRVKSEVAMKAAKFQSGVVIPTRVKGVGRVLSASVPLKELGAGDFTKWGYQVVMQSNEGFPSSTDLLTRKVNEFEGQHRFGGGSDTDCDPHAMDVLAGSGTGDKGEIDLQHQMLSFECNADGTSKKMATLTMVHK